MRSTRESPRIAPRGTAERFSGSDQPGLFWCSRSCFREVLLPHGQGTVPPVGTPEQRLKETGGRPRPCEIINRFFVQQPEGDRLGEDSPADGRICWGVRARGNRRNSPRPGVLKSGIPRQRGRDSRRPPIDPPSWSRGPVRHRRLDRVKPRDGTTNTLMPGSKPGCCEDRTGAALRPSRLDPRPTRPGYKTGWTCIKAR